MILRTEDWNRRNSLCKQYGFRAAIVYQQTPGGWPNTTPACMQRLRVKEWLGKRFGPAMTLNYSKEWINVNSDWLAYRSRDDEYTIAVKDTRLRNWILILQAPLLYVRNHSQTQRRRCKSYF